MKAISVSLLVAAVSLTPVANAAEFLRESVAKDYDENLEQMFLHFHRNPELSNLESETAKRLAAEIRVFGYEVTEGVGGTGIVAVLKNGPGPTVMIRADMDGLPLKEDSGLGYASQVTQVDEAGIEQSVMHACGHDVHITALIGTARQMAERSDDWSGTLVLIGRRQKNEFPERGRCWKTGFMSAFPSLIMRWPSMLMQMARRAK